MSTPLQELPARTDAVRAIRLEPGGGVALETSAYAVAQGRVEIYALVAERRRFLAELSEGAWLPGGFDGLIAVAPDGATLHPLGRDAVAASGAAEVEALVARLDAWVIALGEGLSRLAPARPDLRGIEADDELPAQEPVAETPPEGLAAAQGVVWLTADEPALRFMGGPASAGPLPVTPAAWALRDTATPARGSATAATLSRHGAAALLRRFHDDVARTLTEAIAAAEAAERIRIAAREAHTQSELAEARGRLARVLEERARDEAAEHDDIGFVLSRVAPGTTASPDATSLHAAADAAGVALRAVILDERWWRADRGALATRRLSDSRPVALLPDWLGRYRMHVRGEPARRVTAARAATLDRDALQLLPPLPNRALRPHDIALLGVALCRADFVTLAIAGLATSLLGLALPFALGVLIDNFVPDQLRGATLVLGIALAMLSVCNVLLHLASDLARLRIDGRLSIQIETGVIDRVLRLPSRLLRDTPSADLAMRMLSIEQLRHSITSIGLSTLLGGVFALSNLVVLGFYDLRAAAVALALFVLMLATSVTVGIMQMRVAASGQEMSARLTSLTLQMIQQIATLRAFAAETRAFVRWAHATAALRGRLLRGARIAIAFDCFISAYDVLALAGIFAVLGTAAAGDRLPIGAYLAFVGIYQSFLHASEGLAHAASALLQLRPTVARAALILGTAPENPPSALDPGKLEGAIEASSLSFAYGRDLPLVLDGLSFKIEPGQFVAFAGPSGCGKSTLMSLMLGFDAPRSGTVLFDGRELAHLDRTKLRRQIGIVRQSGRLFAGSIYENILGLHPGTLDDAWEAAELAGIADDINALPMGMHTVVNEGVSTFSGGQVQRMLIARGLAGRPRILILDEATSALDNVAQAEVSRNIERLGITRIVVAHRLSTVRNADVIHFLEGGRIVESGPFDALAAANGRFAAFSARQLL